MIDRYTKAVLTLIAGCLVVIVFRGQLLPDARAENPIHVIVDSVDRFAFRFTTVPVKVQP
jgi:hypothetical protein